MEFRGQQSARSRPGWPRRRTAKGSCAGGSLSRSIPRRRRAAAPAGLSPLSRRPFADRRNPSSDDSGPRTRITPALCFLWSSSSRLPVLHSNHIQLHLVTAGNHFNVSDLHHPGAVASLCPDYAYALDLRRSAALQNNGWCLYVRLSVCRVPRPNWKTESPRKPKSGRMEAHHTGNPEPILRSKGQRSMSQGYKV